MCLGWCNLRFRCGILTERELFWHRIAVQRCAKLLCSSFEMVFFIDFVHSFSCLSYNVFFQVEFCNYKIERSASTSIDSHSYTKSARSRYHFRVEAVDVGFLCGFPNPLPLISRRLLATKPPLSKRSCPRHV